MGELTFFLGLQVKQKEDEIFISKDKYVIEILKKFGFTDVKTASTPMETQKPLLKDKDGEEVDIMFAVCVYARYQVNPKVSHLYVVKRIFRYLKGQPKLGLWYPKDSPFDLVAYTDSDYAGASMDRKSTTGGHQYLGCRLISWQCKKQTVISNSTTKAEYVAASSCYSQVLWIQNQLLYYGTLRLDITLSEKKLIQMIKIHTDKNVADLLTKAFDVNWNGKAAKDEFGVKTINGEVQLQALVDGKKIIITESIIRRDLQLEDAEGIDCLPNAAIFEQFTLMGYEKLSQKLTFYKAFFSPQWKFLIHTILQCLSAKTTAWNEFSSTMASAIICLATNQKFNFSKYIFDSMVKNVDNVNKFLMYPRFVQMFVNQQAGDMSNHKRIYVTPSHTKKVFGNMKREGKGFSGRVTPLFPTMMVQAQQEQGEGSANPTDPQHTPTIAQPSSSQPQKKHKPRKPKKKDTQIPQSSVPSENIAEEVINEENVPTHSNDPLLSGEDRLKLEELMALCTNLQNRVLDLEHTKTTQALKIDSLKWRVKKLEKKQRSKQGRKIHDIDANEEITLENVHDEDITANPVTTVGEVVTTANVEVSTTSPTAATKTIDELTLSQTLAELKSARPKIKGVVMQEPSETTTTTIPSKDKEVIRLQAQFDEEERIAREKEEDNAALIAQWNDT
ncbi:hypothetical protein Tco_1330698 [Tanacetum coccineum]